MTRGHRCPYGCEGDCDVPEHLRGQRDYFAALVGQLKVELAKHTAPPQPPKED